MFRRLDIPDVVLHIPKRFEDDRGHFSETFREGALDPYTGPVRWVQDNQALSRPKGVLRGLHFQVPPFAQDKLVRCVRGSVLDVAVDIRRGSPTFGRHVAVRLSAEGGEQVFVPKGFAHGYLTLEENCEIAYKVSAFYSREHDRGVRWNDPALAIDWGVGENEVVLSRRDADAPLLAASPDHFRYGG